MGLLDAVGKIAGEALKPVYDLIDNIHTSDEEKLTLRAKLLSIEATLKGKMIDAETELLTSQHALMTAEVQQDDKLTKRWRPVIGLGFFGLIALIYGKAAIFGGEPIQVPDPLFWLVSAVLGVQIAGRSWEKVTAKKNGA